MQIAEGLAPVAVYANHFTCEPDGEYIVSHFVYRTAAGESESVAVSLTLLDLKAQRENFAGYLEDLASFVAAPTEAPPRRGRAYSAKTVQAANLIQLSRMGNNAESTFCLFSLHELITQKNSGKGEAVQAQPVLTVRSHLQMQLSFVLEILEFLDAAK